MMYIVINGKHRKSEIPCDFTELSLLSRGETLSKYVLADVFCALGYPKPKDKLCDNVNSLKYRIVEIISASDDIGNCR